LLVVAAAACGGRTLGDDYGAAGTPGSGGSGHVGTGGGFSTGGATTASGGIPGVGGVAGAAIILPGDSCISLGTVADGSDGLVDDLEDGDDLTRFADHRAGAWWTAAGDGCEVVPTPGFAALPAPPSGSNVSLYAMQVSGANCSPSTWGLNTGLGLNIVDRYACAYDASVYDGVQFWAMGLGVQLLTQVATRQTLPELYGGDGSCDGFTGTTTGCWDNFGVTFGLSGQWALYAYSWDDLMQAGWGTRVPFDVTQTAELIFQVPATTSTTTFAIDDVRFYRGSPDPTPPKAGP
jgi:hypothetical protein